MPIQAELKIDANYFTESLRETPKGYLGVRNFRVNTALTAKALFADGVPNYGDLWGHAELDARGLKVMERETFLIGGRVDGDGTGGWTRVEVRYETPTATPIRIPADVNAQWTDIIPGRGQFNQLRAIKRVDINPVTGEVVGAEYDDPQHLAIANGDGCQVDYGLTEVRVYTFLPLGSGLNLSRLMALSQPSKLNGDTVQLPPLYRDTMPIRCLKGQLRYVNYEPSVVGQLRQLVHVMEMSNDFYFRWVAKDHSGQPAGDPLGARVYYYDNFLGLWR